VKVLIYTVDVVDRQGENLVVSVGSRICMIDWLTKGTDPNWEFLYICKLAFIECSMEIQRVMRLICKLLLSATSR
jgi:hypothetical protein